MKRKLFRCRWPSGQITLVTANDVPGALDLLDSIADPTHTELFEVKAPLLLTLNLTDDAKLTVEEWGGQATDSESEIWHGAYPVISKADDEAIDRNLSPDEHDSIVAASVQPERDHPLLTHGLDVFEEVYGSEVDKADPDKREAIRKFLRIDRPKDKGQA